MIGLLKEFEKLFDGTLGKLDTFPVNLEVNTASKPFNYRYHLVPRISKETLIKELMQLYEIGVLPTVQKLEYGSPVFIIPKSKAP